MKRDWDDEFANSAYIPGSEQLPGLWAAQAAEYRAELGPSFQTLSYGDHPRHKLDLIRPEGACRGLMVFVHGGFWLDFDRTDWTHFAKGARANGWAVALPGYRLSPEAELREMVRDIGAAITRAAKLVEGPIRLAGHSAGGHLVTRQICQDSPLPELVRARIARVVSISGLHDLRPLLSTKMNDSFGLTNECAAAESPVLLRPLPGADLVCWVGASERPEFLRQSRLMAMIWDALAQTDLVEERGMNHFSILDGLQDAGSAITKRLLGLTEAA